MTLLNKHGFVDTYGPKVGYCNICDSYGPLTADHVPPKGTLKFPQVDLLHIAELLGAHKPEGKRKSRRMQSGVHFRSLCNTCNNVLLGARYDPALVELTNSVSLLLKGAVAVPDTTFVTVTPGAVARSVLGHLLAVGIERREKPPLLQAAVSFFLDDSLPMPPGLDIHYWVYPYRRQIAIRDAALITMAARDQPFSFWCLKYFPLAFMLVWDQERRRLTAPNLKDFMLNAGMHPAQIPVPLRPIPPPIWPEQPSDDSAVMYGDGAIGALPRKSR